MVVVALLLLVAACAAVPPPPVPAPVSPSSVAPRPAGAMLCTTGDGGTLYLPFFDYSYDGHAVTVHATDGEEYRLLVAHCYLMGGATR